MAHSRNDDLCSQPDCPEPHMLEAMAACMATEGYGAMSDPGAALAAWRGGIAWPAMTDAPCIEFRWAHEARLFGLPTPEELEASGWIRVRRHPFWPASWLMRKGALGHVS